MFAMEAAVNNQLDRSKMTSTSENCNCDVLERERGCSGCTGCILASLYVPPVLVVESESEPLSDTGGFPSASDDKAVPDGSSLEWGCERDVYMDQSIGMRRSVIKPQTSVVTVNILSPKLGGTISCSCKQQQQQQQQQQTSKQGREDWKMKVAQVLSDLTSLRVCNQKAALDLVSARPGTASTGTGSVEAVRQRTAALLSGTNDENDPDLQRAKDLVELHYAVKVKHLSKGTGGVEVDESLEDARHAVKVAMREMMSV
ncbi:Zinc finger transcription factor [Venturia nashicola]|nr:Zinc finger transcription factor [Venturia nashicola]